MWLAVAAFATAECCLTTRTENAFFVLSVASPVAAGTGLASSASRGRFDLLLGAGVSRSRVYALAMLGVVVFPALLLIILAPGSSSSAVPTLALVARSGGLAVFTLGIAFAVGLHEPKWAIGVLWIAARVVFLASPPGLRTLALLRVSVDSCWNDLPQKMLASLLMPELLLHPAIPSALSTVAGVLGLVALLGGHSRFLHLDLSGERSE